MLMHEMVGNKIGSGVEDYCVAQQIINSLASLSLFFSAAGRCSLMYTLSEYLHIASSALGSCQRTRTYICVKDRIGYSSLRRGGSELDNLKS